MTKFYEPAPPPKHPTPNYTPEERKKEILWTVVGVVGMIACLPLSYGFIWLLHKIITAIISAF